MNVCFFFSSRRRHTRYWRDWSSDVCSSDLAHEVTHGRAEVAARVEKRGGTLHDHTPRPLALFRSAHRASTTASLHRDTHTGLPSSSRISTSQTWFVLPTCTGVPTAVNIPSLLGLRWLALISDPNATLPSGQLSHAPVVATVSANTTLAPPCRKPRG